MISYYIGFSNIEVDDLEIFYMMIACIIIAYKVSNVLDKKLYLKQIFYQNI